MCAASFRIILPNILDALFFKFSSILVSVQIGAHYRHILKALLVRQHCFLKPPKYFKLDFFLRNTILYRHTLTSMKYACTSYPYEHLGETESPNTPRYRQKHRLPLKEYFVFMRHSCQIWSLNI
jgi:hypothetical protein